MNHSGFNKDNFLKISHDLINGASSEHLSLRGKMGRTK